MRGTERDGGVRKRKEREREREGSEVGSSVKESGELGTTNKQKRNTLRIIRLNIK